MDFPDGPYLMAALLCERVERTADGRRNLVGLLDTVVKDGEEDPAQMTPLVATVFIVVQFRSGSARGSMELGIRPTYPSGLRKGGSSISIFFAGDETASGIELPLDLTLDETGLYWFDILLDSQLVTRIPLRVRYRRIRQGV